MKTKIVISAIAICAAVTLSFGFASVNSKEDKNQTVSIEKKSFDHEANIGLLSEDKL